METFRSLVILVSVGAFIGTAIYAVAWMFYAIPKTFEGRPLNRAETMNAIPKHLRRFGNLCIGTFLGLLAFALVVEFFAILFRASSK